MESSSGRGEHQVSGQSLLASVPLPVMGVAVSGVLLAGTLAFLPWHQVDLGLVSASSTGLGAPDSVLGILAFLLALGVAGVVVATRVASWRPPALPVELPVLVVGGSVLSVALLVLKLVLHTQFLGIGCWLSLAFGIALVVTSVRASRPVVEP